MRVCLITAEFPPQVGGLGDYTHLLATALSHNGVQVNVLTSAGPTTNEHPYNLRRTIPGWGFGLFGSVEQEIQRLKPDIIHIQYQTGAYGMHPAINFLPRWLRSKRIKARTVTTFHDLRDPYLFPKAGPVRTWTTRQLAQGSDSVVTTNPEDRASLQRILRSGSRERLIPIGPNIPTDSPPEPTTATRERLGIPSEVPLLTFFGLLHPTKGIETLLEGVSLLNKQGQAVALVLIGGDEASPLAQTYRLRLQRRVAELGIAGQVHWTGYLSPEDAARALAAADCCVLPFTTGVSYRHGSLIAALALGVPVVATTPPHPCNYAPLPPLQDGVNCRLAPPGDPQQLAEAIASLLADSGQREQLARGARETARAFSWDAIASQTVSFYQEVLAGDKP